MKLLIHCILFGLLGLVLVANGLTIFTWGYWAIILIVILIYFQRD